MTVAVLQLCHVSTTLKSPAGAAQSAIRSGVFNPVGSHAEAVGAQPMQVAQTSAVGGRAAVHRRGLADRERP